MKVGIAVYCTVCLEAKAPHGRSVPLYRAGSLCDDNCAGYREEPFPGCLWPGETEAEFGYHVCSHATEERELVGDAA